MGTRSPLLGACDSVISLSSLSLRGETQTQGAGSSVGSQRLVNEFVRLTRPWPWSDDLLAQLRDWESSTGHRSDVLE